MDVAFPQLQTLGLGPGLLFTVFFGGEVVLGQNDGWRWIPPEHCEQIPDPPCGGLQLPPFMAHSSEAAVSERKLQRGSAQ